MSLDTLPGQIFADVVSWLHEKVLREQNTSTRHPDTVDCTFEHDAKATLQCFSPLSKTLHALVRTTQQLYLHVHDIEGKERGPACKPAIALGCSLSVVDGRIASLFASSFRSVAAQLVIVDMRLTDITATSVITILRTCPSLEELDVGGCERLNVIELASSLKELPPENLAVRRLQTMEICGSGHDENWVGYRQKMLPYNPEAGDFSRWYGGRSDYYPGFDSYVERVHDEAFNSRLERLGSPDVLPAVRAIEDIIHALQQSSSFWMQVNGCENCLKFAQFLSEDGKGFIGFSDAPYDKTYGQHTCMKCGDAHFLCLDCVGYKYHYCYGLQCPACVCVKCDGGLSLKGEHESGDLAWEDLQDTLHFTTVNCCMECENEYMTICKEKEACIDQDLCEVCGLWLCPNCAVYGNELELCEKCKRRACSDGCLVVEECDSCAKSFCNECDTVRLCKDGCGDSVRHCRDCYRDHPDAVRKIAEREEKKRAWLSSISSDGGPIMRW
jgi:hypothetical protein